MNPQQHAPLPYQKPWRSYADQVDILRARGLHIHDESSAIDFLRHVNYYRFSGYCVAFESVRHQFKSGTTFEQVHASYEFDRILRDIVTEALEIVELEFRTSISHYFGEAYGAFGHTNPSNFYRFDHRVWLDKLHAEANRSKEQFVVHFKTTYREYPDLPIWVIAELMSFGSLSRMCKGMLKKDRKQISHQYGLQPHVLPTWLHHLTYVRNLCAHHSRLWDRLWAIKPHLPAGMIWQPPHLPGNNRLFCTLLILNYLMARCPTAVEYASEWRFRVEELLDQPPAVENSFLLMGLPDDWARHPIWI